MAEKKAVAKAPSFSLPTISNVSGEEAYKKGPVILVFYDRHGSDFWAKRLSAFEAKLPQYHRQNVQVLGISVDGSVETASWAKQIGITFPLLSDKGGKVAKRFGLFDAKTNKAAKAVAVVLEGKLVYSKKVTDTEVPFEILPWTEKLATTGRWEKTATEGAWGNKPMLKVHFERPGNNRRSAWLSRAARVGR